MRKIFFVLFVLSFVKFSAQNKSREVFDFLNINSNRIYAESKGFYFLNVPEKKNYKERLSGEIFIKDTSKVKFDEIDVEFFMDDYRYYLEKHHNLLFVLKSVNHIKKEISNEK